jgi:hypothetical protein
VNLKAMETTFDDVPEAMQPGLRMAGVDAPISVEAGDLAFVTAGGETRSLIGEFKLRWHPNAGIEFEGEGDLPMIHSEPTTLASTTDLLPEGSVEFARTGQRTPVILTHANIGMGMRPLRFVLQGVADVTTDPNVSIERVAFYLVNFPNYRGSPVRRKTNGHTLFDGRLVLNEPGMTCTVDRIVEHDPLLAAIKHGGGFLITHVGELVFSKPAAQPDVKVTLQGLALFFGFLRGGWCGPVLPQGYAAASPVWRQLTSWRIDEPGVLATWLPQRPTGLDGLFENFLESSRSGDWAEPMRTALDWYFSANSLRAQSALRLVISLIALELLANVEVVEMRKTYPADEFKAKDAFIRISALFDALNIPKAVPSHLIELAKLVPAYGKMAPEVLTRLRNKLVHATATNRASLTPVSALQLWEASQLAISYVELSLLAIFGYRGKYARRGIQGWRGEEEENVPWL